MIIIIIIIVIIKKKNFNIYFNISLSSLLMYSKGLSSATADDTKMHNSTIALVIDTYVAIFTPLNI